MAQLSRPYQIALVALLVLGLAWVALGMHHGSPSAPGSGAASASAPSSTHAAAPAASSNPNLGAEEAKKAAAPSPIYHGSAPGVEGLSRAVDKAHEAVATSQGEARKTEEQSARASGEAPAAAAAAPAAAPSAAGKRSTGKSAPSHASAPAPASKRSAAEDVLTPSGQRAVEAALAAGKVPVLLFWNPDGADDVSVHGQVRQVSHSRLPIAVYEGNAEAVASYGAITREVPVYGTPTILIVAKNGQTTELTGLQEHFSIEQAIEEALHA